jgi:Na+-driven multidrug efflux pump
LAFRWDELGREIMGIAVPGALALMADPVASLVDTAFIGHIGLLLFSPYFPYFF